MAAEISDRSELQATTMLTMLLKPLKLWHGLPIGEAQAKIGLVSLRNGVLMLYSIAVLLDKKGPIHGITSQRDT
jgi:hypothetical protein